MKLRLFYAIVVLILISGCSLNKVDPILTGQDNCYPPCWRQIQPGLTTMTKALEVIMGLESDSRYHIVKPFIYFSYNDQISNRIHINVDEIVDWVELDLNPIELSQVISKFGEPDYLFFGIDSGVCVVNLLYPNTGIYFQGNCKASIVGDYWTISPNTKLYSVYFLEPQKQVDDLLLRFFGDDIGIAMKDAIRPWAGYGKYSIYP